MGRVLYSIDQIETNNLNDKKEEFKNFLKQLDQEIISLNNVKFYNNEFSSILWEYFTDNPFLEGNFENRTVIDIGANIADTPLFLAQEGATVFAFEPVPETYEMGKENIELNPDLKNNIHMYNNAISGENEFIKIYTETNEDSAGANSFIKTEKWIEIEAFTIKQIIEKFNIKPDILKMDCEGAEYSIIKKSDLSCFKKIMLEYHEKFVDIPYQVLVTDLEKMGFKVSVKSFHPYNLNEFGFIIATKD